MKNQYISQINNSRLNTELESLVKEVLKKSDRIIPIIGDDCFVGEINGNNVPLQSVLCAMTKVIKISNGRHRRRNL